MTKVYNSWRAGSHDQNNEALAPKIPVIRGSVRSNVDRRAGLRRSEDRPVSEEAAAALTTGPSASAAEKVKKTGKAGLVDLDALKKLLNNQ